MTPDKYASDETCQYSWYGAHIVDLTNDRVVYSECADETVESASMIKAPIGLLALKKSLQHYGDATCLQARMTVRNNHIARQATTLFHPSKMAQLKEVASTIRSVRNGWSVSFGDVLELSSVYSDATATNTLIEYLGGKERINKQLGRVGLESSELLVDTIDFADLAHADLSPRIGKTTMRAYAQYYAHLDTTAETLLGREAAEYYTDVLQRTVHARFFSCDREDIPPGMTFAHKTGSIFDLHMPDGQSQAIIADAGVLTLQQAGETKRHLAVAAETQVIRSDLSGVNRTFAQRNLQHIDSMSHSLR